MEERSNRSADDLFSDAVTEFSDDGISPGVEEQFVGSDKNLNGDSFKKTENAGTTQLLNSPMEVRKAEENLEVFLTPDTDTKDADKAEEKSIAKAKIKLPEFDRKASDPLVENRDGSHQGKFINPEPSAKEEDVSSSHIGTLEVSDNKEQREEAVYVLSVPSNIPLVDHSETLIDDFKDHKTVCSNVPATIDAEIISTVDTFEVKTMEEKVENSESLVNSTFYEHTNTVPESTDLIESEVSLPKHSVVALSERVEAVVAESTNEEIEQEKLEYDYELGREVVKEAEIVKTEEDVGAPDLEKHSEAYTWEIVKENESGGAGSKDRGSIGISHTLEKLILEEAEQAHSASGVVSEAVVDEGNGKLMTGQDCGVDVSVGSSSHNSLEGNWGSVSVLSTTSIDTEYAQSIDKSGIAADKRRLGKSSVFKDSPLVEPEEEIIDHNASEIKPVAVRNSEQLKSEASQAGWAASSVGNASNDSEGRKRNKEAIAKVTNWSTGQHTSTPLKSLVGEAKSPNRKHLSTMIQKDEVGEKKNETGNLNLTSETPLANLELSPPKYIGESKKVRKKAKGSVLWVPFACCSSVNVN